MEGNSFKTILKKLRDKKGLSQTQLANKLHVAQNTVSNWETGNREPDWEMMSVIANFFGVTMDFLLGRTETKNTSFVAETKGTFSIAETNEVDEILEALHKRPEMKTLFSLSRKASKEDIEKTMKIIETLRGK